MFDSWRGFGQRELSDEWFKNLTEIARIARGNIIKMTTVAASGHPGGSMSSLECYLVAYHMAKVDPKQPYRDDRDRIIVSHGHTSPGAYVGLASAGFFDVYPALHGFRQAGSPFEGHVEKTVPGIEWDTGNLGQGLSVAVGKAIYSRLKGLNFHSFCLMGDGEQQKGQIAEARRAAVKFKLNRLTAIVDYNHLQISGNVAEIMPQNIKAGWESDGWQVIEIDGHDLKAVYRAFHTAYHNSGAPVMILAKTVMGKGVSFMENDAEYHGAALKPDQARKAFVELGGIEDDLDQLMERRKQGPPPQFDPPAHTYISVDTGAPIRYKADDKSDNRSAWGKALISVAEANIGRPGFTMAVFDCDLSKSVKTDGFDKKFPRNFFQMGITEHGTAATAGALSTEQALSVWSDFGVFGVDETYNQARLNDINHANLKLFCTHTGVNVGEDGKTHQCIDYFALLNSTFGWKVITPADPNQTDQIVRYVLSHPGSFGVFMGRAVVPTVLREDGSPYFGEGYTYRYGRMEVIRKGEEIALVSSGNMLPYAMQAWNMLKDEGNRITLVSVSDWSDLDEDDLRMLAGYRHIVTLEDHNVKTGLGTAIAARMFELGLATQLTKIGVPHYASSGKPDDLYTLLGMDAASVAARIQKIGKNTGVII
ncbi:MAG: transketolase [candidate division Zixibacteria bacterium]|nr:transketolase [candidate division Zixibacteria bacterium]